jgi:hypothetical protein
MRALDVGEIDNKLGPDVGGADRGRENRRSQMSVTDVYRRRNSQHEAGAEDLGRKLAKVIQEYGSVR